MTFWNHDRHSTVVTAEAIHRENRAQLRKLVQFSLIEYGAVDGCLVCGTLIAPRTGWSICGTGRAILDMTFGRKLMDNAIVSRIRPISGRYVFKEGRKLNMFGCDSPPSK